MSAPNLIKFPCGSCRDTRDAAGVGHLPCLQFAHDSGCPWHPETTCGATINGHLSCLQYVVENACCLWDPDTTYVAAKYNRLACLQYIYENCGDVATWEHSGLQDFEQDNLIPERIKEYLRSVEDDWKNGGNASASVKPALRSQ